MKQLEIVVKIKETYQHTLKFGNLLSTAGEPIVDNRIELFEKKYDIILTEEFKYILKLNNGFSLGGGIYGLGEEFGGGSLEKMYELMHQHFQDFIPKRVVPFSSDGAGNCYCLYLDIKQTETCPILFYQQDYDYENFNEIEVCNASLAEWIDEVCIGWTLQDYDYDGNSKSDIFYRLKHLFKKEK
ncbi:hypothetical protein CNR22_12130 [Sphingobacteriaceae bacterium]|nr:hypothetical protein CNR22_12130 [Sphingobacteriaceae bacterium]